MSTARRLTCLAVGTAVALGATAAGARVDLLSHRAIYRLSLIDAERSIGVTAIKGGVVLETRKSCEGTISNQRIGFVASLEDGPDFVYDVRFSSWESPDNMRLRFNVRSFDDGRLFEEYRGEARLEGEGGAGHAAFIRPEAGEIALPRGTLFPTEHMRRLIESAERGDMVVSHDVFDGSGFEGLNRVTAVIGRAEATERPAPDGAGRNGSADDGSRRNVPERSWPVSLAYHTTMGDDDLPSFEVTFDLGDDGVLHDLVLDYGDFALKAEMEQLETFPAPDCR